MDVCLPSDFLALRASVDSDWRDGCAGSSSMRSRDDEEGYSMRATGSCTAWRPAERVQKPLTSIQADPAWQVI